MNIQELRTKIDKIDAEILRDYGTLMRPKSHSKSFVRICEHHKNSFEETRSTA